MIDSQINICILEDKKTFHWCSFGTQSLITGVIIPREFLNVSTKYDWCIHKSGPKGIKLTKYLKSYTVKDVVELMSKKEKLPKKIIYNLCIKHKKK